jgi:hypothetical protein
MTASEHLIVYAAPEHVPPPTLECSCGWKTIGEPRDGLSYRDVLKELLARWMSHTEEATASSG